MIFIAVPIATIAKAAVAVLSNEKTRKAVGWVIAASTFSTTADIYSHLDFHAQIESGLVINDDHIDNRFYEPAGRFPQIEEALFALQ